MHKLIEKARIKNPRRDRFGITPKLWNVLIARQQNKCAICKRTFVRTDFSLRPNVDHDHKTNKIRGLLCNSCNRGIAFLKEDITILNNAIEFLERPLFNIPIIPIKCQRPRIKLTEKQRQDICLESGTAQEIALKYGVSSDYVNYLLKRRSKTVDFQI
jgi:hypothetical protein